MGAVVEQANNASWQPLTFFSRKFTPSQLKYSTFDRELTAIYEAIRHFRYLLEGREFTIYTDHKPLIYAFIKNSDRSPRQSRLLSYIAQFSTKIEYLADKDNNVANSLSRIETIRFPTQFDLSELSSARARSGTFLKSSDHFLSLKKLTWGPNHTQIYCDIGNESLRPYLPKSLRERVFDLYHATSHPSAKITDRLIRQRFVWPNMHKDKLCLQKLHRLSTVEDCASR